MVLPALVATSPMKNGLGNRMQLVLSAQAIADAEGRTFYYHWPVGKDGRRQFGARLDDCLLYTSPSPRD